ncbi:hypothetical protein LEMLEM_LOCUS7490 [Lemmus lemmus]
MLVFSGIQVMYNTLSFLLYSESSFLKRSATHKQLQPRFN